MTSNSPRCVSQLVEAAKAAHLELSDPAFVVYLDQHDALSPLRNEFVIPGSEDGNAYMCAHALGPVPKKVGQMLADEVDAWGKVGINGHTNHPKGLHWTLGTGVDERYVSVLADLVGALPSEVALMGGLTTNLHLLMDAFYHPDKGGRHKIIYEANAFPSDRYAFDSQARLLGLDPTKSLVGLLPRDSEDCLRTEDILAAIDEHGSETALVIFGAVQSFTGQFFDMESITGKAKAVGAVSAWDCAHATGNVPMRLHDWGVDFAVWCSYKYLNAGPGATAGIFVHEKHFDRLRPAGWWGQELQSRFAPGVPFKPRLGAAGFAVSNPSLFATVPLHASLEIMQRIPDIYEHVRPLPSLSLLEGEVGTGSIMPLLRQKSILLTGYLEYILTSPEMMGSGIDRLRIVSPQDTNERASCLSVVFLSPADHDEKGDGSTYSSLLIHVSHTLAAAGVIVEKRAPNLIRFSPSALYNTFEEIWRTAMAVKRALA